MNTIHSIHDIRLLIADKKRQYLSIGFVPTMGALHEGHLALIKHAKTENDLCIASIFVNPLQFNNKEDFNKYPIQHEKDLELLKQAGCDLVFMPKVNEFYPSTPLLSINMGRLDTILEGAHRPGHFSGVAIVVSKLFNTIQPDKAYFGQKDLQQVSVIRQLVSELNFPIEIVSCPIIREQSGLAMSSRNMRLSTSGRQLAANLNKALLLMEKSIAEGEKNPATVQEIGLQFIYSFPEIQLEYLGVVNGETLEYVSTFEGLDNAAICVAAFVEGVRLIDNLVIIV
ncbi:MAG: pantoate--beta-alanine ligase [Cytophagales bacterium]|nr:pantoate--beta-alanine ligase [Cytophaga sp.]